jgi:hypothetical protein
MRCLRGSPCEGHLEHWFYGLSLIAVTVLIHVLGLRLMIAGLQRWLSKIKKPESALGRVMVVASLVVAILHHVEVALWAGLYLRLGIFDERNTAVYFSFITMTTTGYGDITLSGEPRLLAAFQAMNGMLLFGLSTAFLFAVLQETFRNRGSRPL